jgi:hypothetical protein
VVLKYLKLIGLMQYIILIKKILKYMYMQFGSVWIDFEKLIQNLIWSNCIYDRTFQYTYRVLF